MSVRITDNIYGGALLKTAASVLKLQRKHP